MRLIFAIILITHFGLFSQQTIGLMLNTEESFNGYTLWTVGHNTYLIDNCGYEVNRWESEFNPGLSVYLTEESTLIRPGSTFGQYNGAGSGGIIEEFDWEGNLIWQFDVSTQDFQQHHDIEPLPNSNILFIAWERRFDFEAEQAGALMPRTYWPEVIYEIRKDGMFTGEIVWEWHLWDHLVQDIDSTKINYGVIKDNPGKININYQIPSLNGPGGGGDWLHFNGLDYDQEKDLILISARHTSEVLIIDHSTTTEEARTGSGGRRGKGGDFLFRWGNQEAYDCGDFRDQVFYGQHDAKFIEGPRFPKGSISVFNNGSGRSGINYSSVDVILPKIDNQGEYLRNEFGRYYPDSLSWQYTADPPNSFFSNNMAGAQYLENGNFLICEANQGRFFEVDSLGQTVWHYENTGGQSGPLTQGIDISGQSVGSVFRSERYAPDFPGFVEINLNSGAPIELEPIEYDCEIFDETSSVTLSEFPDRRSFINNFSFYGHQVQIIFEEFASYNLSLFDLVGNKIWTKEFSGTILNDELRDIPTGILVLHLVETKSNRSQNIKFFNSRN